MPWSSLSALQRTKPEHSSSPVLLHSKPLSHRIARSLRARTLTHGLGVLPRAPWTTTIAFPSSPISAQLSLKFVSHRPSMGQQIPPAAKKHVTISALPTDHCPTRWRRVCWDAVNHAESRAAPCNYGYYYKHHRVPPAIGCSSGIWFGSPELSVTRTVALGTDLVVWLRRTPASWARRSKRLAADAKTTKLASPKLIHFYLLRKR